MKKKIRNISVDGVDYSWVVDEVEWPELVLRVWRSKNDVLFEEHLDAHGGPVTPSMVAAFIQQRS